MWPLGPVTVTDTGPWPSPTCRGKPRGRGETACRPPQRCHTSVAVTDTGTWPFRTATLLSQRSHFRLKHGPVGRGGHRCLTPGHGPCRRVASRHVRRPRARPSAPQLSHFCCGDWHRDTALRDASGRSGLRGLLAPRLGERRGDQLRRLRARDAVAAVDDEERDAVDAERARQAFVLPDGRGERSPASSSRTSSASRPTSRGQALEHLGRRRWPPPR